MNDSEGIGAMTEEGLEHIQKTSRKNRYNSLLYTVLVLINIPSTKLVL
jgi:hypothetical protein